MDDVTDQQSTQPNGSSNGSEETLPLAPMSQGQRVQRSAWITERVKRILSAYRRDDYADPEGFIAQLGMIFERYPDDVIEEVTSPLTGIQVKSDYPPSLAKVSDACKEEMRRKIQLRKWRAMKRSPRQIAGPVSIANLYVSKGNSQYSVMVERSRSADSSEFRFDDGGIWVAETWIKAAGYLGVR